MSQQVQLKAYTPEEVAEIYQVSKNTIYKMIKDNKIRAKRISGRIYRIPYTEIMWVTVGLDRDIQQLVANDLAVLDNSGFEALKKARKSIKR